MYGTPWIIAPEIYTGWVSWFNGDATNLLPTEPVEKSRRFVALMGGRDKVMAEAEKAFHSGDGQFAAELTQMLVSIDHNDWDARYLKAASLRQRGYEEINTIARAWYLKGANELEGKIDPNVLMKMGMRVVQGEMTSAEILASWRYQVDAQKAGSTRLSLGFNFTDSGENYVVELRNSILEINEMPVPAGMAMVNLNTQQLQSVLDGKQPKILGDGATLNQLIAYLDRDVQGFSMHVR
jgi:alkyl sulfatase BDS1-like metallo-beta-lactamase superfamily hydrolase